MEKMIAFDYLFSVGSILAAASLAMLAALYLFVAFAGGQSTSGDIVSIFEFNPYYFYRNLLSIESSRFDRSNGAIHLLARFLRYTYLGTIAAGFLALFFSFT